MAPFTPSRMPAALAAASALALLYGDRAAPLLLSPQTGWHFAAAARWIWLTFAAAGAAKGLLLTLALLRAAAGPPAALHVRGRAAANNCAAVTAGKALAAGIAASTGAVAAAPPQGFGPAAAQALLLRVLAALSFVAASAAAAAKPASQKLGCLITTNRLLTWYNGEDGAPKAGEILAVATLGPLFWALGFAFAAAAAHALLAGKRRSLLRRAAAIGAAGAVITAAALEALGSEIGNALAKTPLAAPLIILQELWELLVPSLPMPPKPVLVTFGATTAVFGLLTTSAPLWVSSGQPAPGLKQMATRRRSISSGASGALSRGVWGVAKVILVPWLAVCGHAVWKQGIVASGKGKEFRTSDNEFKVMWRQESAAGEFLSVVQGDHTKARFQLLKAGHSILGGRYTLPSYFANQSIYDVFYIHEGVRLMKGDGQTSLHIGLGSGVAATALAKHGLAADIIELHPEVVQLAEKFFDWQMNGSVFARDAALAVDDISALQERPAYDHIIHDVFSGGALPKNLFSSAFFVKLRQLMTPDGVLAVNFYGDADKPPARRLAQTLHSVFGNVRAWREGAPSPIRNLVFFASTAPLRVRRPVKEDELQDGGRSAALKRYFDPVDLENAPPDDGSPLNPREMDLSWLRPHFEEQPAPPLEQMVAEQEASAEALLGGGARKLEAADVEAAAHHWRVMRLIFTGSFWSETY